MEGGLELQQQGAHPILTFKAVEDTRKRCSELPDRARGHARELPLKERARPHHGHCGDCSCQGKPQFSVNGVRADGGWLVIC